jgi:hypothetical protein
MAEGSTVPTLTIVAAPDRTSARAPFDFSTLKAGDTEPSLGMPIHCLVARDRDFIVFLDKEHHVHWHANDSTRIAQHGTALSRVSWLEAIPVQHLSECQRITFRRLVAEGVARLFEQNEKVALQALDKAEEWIRARNQETARVWYLEAAVCITLPFLIAMLALVFWGEGLSRYLTPSVFEVIVGGCAGAIGAFLSVLQRTRTTPLDLSAGRLLHRIEGGVSVLTGMFGAALFAVGIKANLVLGNLEPQYLFSTLLVFCMVAGLSERLVPSFVQRVEATAGNGNGANGK